MKKQLVIVFGIAVATIVSAIGLSLILVTLSRPARATTEQAVMETNSRTEQMLVLGHGEYIQSDVTVTAIQETVRE